MNKAVTYGVARWKMGGAKKDREALLSWSG
jgi:hypothetical protein